jgi:hypothetical protein
MPYLNVDDGMDEHPKVESLSHVAFRMHMSGMLYSARRGTDGVVPLAKARRLCADASDAVALELIEAGVWHDLGQGCGTETCVAGVKNAYVIHDYLEWNHSAHWWTKRKREQAERQRKWRESKKRADKDGVS